MTSSDDPRPEQPAETPQEVQRNLPHLIIEVADKLGDGTAIGAGRVVGQKAMEKILGGRGPGKGGDSGPPSDPPPAQTE